MRLERYIPPNLRPQIRGIGNLGYSLLDNVVGFDDGFDSAGERLGRQIRQDPVGTAKAVGSGIAGGVGDLLSDPIGTARGVVEGVGQAYQRAGKGAAGYLPDGVTLKDASMDQIRAANDAYLADVTNVAAIAPAGRAATGVARAASNVDTGALAADAIGTGRALASGDMGLLGEVFQRAGQGGDLSAAKTPNKADLDPLGYQKTKMRGYLSDVDVNLTDTGENLPRTPMSWEDMEGKVVLPFYGDRTSRGLLVEGVNDQRFDRPVYTEGGVDFMRGPAAQQDRAIWASDQGITKRLESVAEKAAQNPEFEGRDIVGVTGSMAPDANDFATFTGAAMAELVKGSPITKASAKEFDDVMRAVDPNFVGVLSPKLRDWATSASSEDRKSFIRLMDSNPMQAAGFPSPAEARYAVTDPTQRDMPSGMFGLGAARVDTSAPRMYNQPKDNLPRATVPHSTYNTQIAGDYLGSLEPVPQGLLFRDLYSQMEGQLTKAGKPLTEAHKTYSLTRKMPAQLVTPQVVDGILEYLSRQGR